MQRGRFDVPWCQACDAEHTKLASHVLQLYGTEALNHRAPDGTTPFMIALAKLNVDLIKVLAQSAIHDWDRIAIQSSSHTSPNISVKLFPLGF